MLMHGVYIYWEYKCNNNSEYKGTSLQSNYSFLKIFIYIAQVNSIHTYKIQYCLNYCQILQKYIIPRVTIFTVTLIAIGYVSSQ